MTVLVFNGWAAGLETWELTTFRRDWTFSYLEQMEGLPQRVMDDIGGDFLFVGFSMGGTQALRLFVENPECVRGLVLVSTTPRMLAGENWPGMSERRMEAFRLGTELIYADDPSPLYEPENLRRGLAFLHDTDLREDLRRLPAFYHSSDFPVRILHSEKDGIVRPQNVDFFKSVFPQSDVTLIPGTEHVLPLTVPERIDAAVASVSSK